MHVAATIETLKKDRQPKSLLEQGVLLACLSVTLLLLYRLLQYGQYGFDFTDEGFYLNWIANPWLYPASTTQFGFIYHSLYLLADENIVLLRQLNVLLTVGLAWSLCVTLLKQLPILGHKASARDRVSLYSAAFLLATSSVACLRSGILTPSYNSLALQALLIASIGCLNCRPGWSLRNFAGAILIGLGGWLAFMAKPTTAAALALVIVFVLAISHRLSLKLIGLSAATSLVLLLLSAWLIDGSIVAFFARLQEGAHQVALMGAGHTLAGALRWDPVSLRLFERQAFAGITAFLFFYIYLAHSTRTTARIIWIVQSLCCLFLCLIVIINPTLATAFNNRFIMLLPVILLLAAVLAAITAANIHIIKKLERVPLATALLFALLPVAYAFGTVDHYAIAAASAAVFWTLASVTVLTFFSSQKATRRALLSISVAAMTVSALLVHLGFEQPYRQSQPLRLQQTPLRLFSNPSQLMVSDDTGHYLHKLQKLALAGGYEIKTPMLDLTGRFPGALFALDAKAIGQAWMIGGYPGSEAQTSVALKLVPCEEITSAWILKENRGPRAISHRVLEPYAIDITRDYLLVGELFSPRNSSGQSFKQQLWKPKRPTGQAVTACHEHLANPL